MAENKTIRIMKEEQAMVVEMDTRIQMIESRIIRLTSGGGIAYNSTCNHTKTMG